MRRRTGPRARRRSTPWRRVRCCGARRCSRNSPPSMRRSSPTWTPVPMSTMRPRRPSASATGSMPRFPTPTCAKGGGTAISAFRPRTGATAPTSTTTSTSSSGPTRRRTRAIISSCGWKRLTSSAPRRCAAWAPNTRTRPAARCSNWARAATRSTPSASNP